ncbi:MAG: nucleotide sugar dehydrogenase [Patescibacteria group bacterium]|nr:nucleotide sugar dehydrogenase [Patescibacteria group bacterium]MDD5715148.1 nucleotide sugar dehydrogenase [Patescibacteria group bacterium]
MVKKQSKRRGAFHKSALRKMKRETLTIVGIGYVGLPLACLCGEKGYRTFGISKDKKKVALINQGVSPIKGDARLQQWVSQKSFTAVTGFESVKSSDIVIICVPTPIDEHYNPDLEPVESACKMIAKYMKRGQLIIMESTVNPGVCEEVIIPILEKGSGLTAGKDFYLAHCPERINPGDAYWNVRNIPRCVGGLNKKSLSWAVRFYRSIISGTIRPMKSLKEAEATKIIENSFRDINIAFVNELAKSFEVLGIDLLDVIEGSKTKPFAFMAHYPSCGVGGHCIPVDPYYLIERARKSGFDHKFLKLAREINNSMPRYAVDRLMKALNEIKKPIKGTSIGVLGLAYKADVDDLRESPAVEIVSILKEEGAKVEIFDPYFPKRSTAPSLEEMLRKVDAVILATDHREFKEMNLLNFKKAQIKVVVDGKNCLDSITIAKMGILYRGIGK